MPSVCGPQWQETVQPIVDCVHMIRRASGGRVDLRAEQQIQLLCHFPVLCHLARGWFVNPGEGGMRPALPARAMYRVGLTMRDQALCDMGGTIVVDKPGVYELSETIRLKDDTALYFGAGVSVRRALAADGTQHQGYVFVNQGA